MSPLVRLQTTVRSGLRVPLALPVKVIIGASEMAQWSCTYDLSRRGARLKQVAGVVEGQNLWIKRHNSKARYRVAWVGLPGSRQAGQFAVECLDGKFIWDSALDEPLCGNLRLLRKPLVGVKAPSPADDPGTNPPAA